jgi:hypothetical protein
MISIPAVCKSVLCLSVTALLFTISAHATGIAATATYTSVTDPSTPGVYDYNLTLNNTGTTTIGTFWFSWIPGGDFLSTTPSSVIAPSGWTVSVFNNGIDGQSIRWVTTTNLLQAGQSLAGFSFDSTESPDQLLLNYNGSGKGAGLPVLTSFVYIGKPLGDPGDQFVASAATPEPGSMLLTLTGLGMAAGSLKLRILRRA